jgi:sulfite exporter TauE/SafE
MQGFVLGLSSGTVCAAYCAPVLVPYLLGEGRGILQNFVALIQFLLGRLLGYLSLAFIAWGIHALLPQDMVRRSLIIGASYLILSALLIFYSVFNTALKNAPMRKVVQKCTDAGRGRTEELRDGYGKTLNNKVDGATRRMDVLEASCRDGGHPRLERRLFCIAPLISSGRASTMGCAPGRHPVQAGRTCRAAGGQGIENRLRGFRPSLLLLTMGLATGLNLCPPLLLAVATAAEQASLLQGVLFFFTFFLGTSLFLAPVPFLGLLKGFHPLHVIGKMSAGLIGAYYLFIGATMLAGGLYR